MRRLARRSPCRPSPAPCGPSAGRVGPHPADGFCPRPSAWGETPSRQDAGSHREMGFILLEVLVSLAIMGIALSMVLRQMTTSMKAIRRTEQVTMATMLARRLVEEWEMTPPEKGESEGDFGEDYPGYTYRAEYRVEPVDYENVPKFEEIGHLVYMRNVSVSVFYTPPRSEEAEAKRILRFETALTSSERFTAMARVSNKIDFDF